MQDRSQGRDNRGGVGTTARARPVASLACFACLARMACVASLLSLLAGHCAAVPEHCFTDAASRYQVDAGLLKAVAMAESDMNATAVNQSHTERTRSRDIGLMQINTSWLPRLATFGITEPHLFDACTNVAVGAWILAGEFAKRGATWDAVGAYNAACTSLKGASCTQARSRYAWRVYRRLAKGPAAPTTATLVATSAPVEAKRPAGLISLAQSSLAQASGGYAAEAGQP